MKTTQTSTRPAMRRPRHVTLAGATACLVIAIVGALAMADAAAASTASLSNQTFTYVAEAGEANALSLEAARSPSGDYVLIVTDPGATITAGPGCRSVSRSEAHCSGATPWDTTVDVTLADKGDSASWHMHGTVSGGDGPDHLSGVGRLLGDSGRDTLVPDWGYGYPVLDGGAGADTLGEVDPCGWGAVDYSSRRQPVRVTLDGLANDGQSGEGDNVLAVDRILGGSGSDVIDASGSCSGHWIDGNAGDDALHASNSYSSLLGGAGNDALAGSSSQWGSAFMIGGDGDDSFAAGAGTDTVAYADYDGAVSVTLDGKPNDGEFGEHDNVGKGIEWLIGGNGDDFLAGKNLDGRNGNDVLLAGDTGNRLYGGFGDDRLRGGGGADLLLGDDGNDALYGGDGSDDLFGQLGDDSLDGGAQADTLSGSDGRDTALYDKRTLGVSVTLDGAANDGEAGEGDYVGSDVEDVTGGSANDRLVGNAYSNVLDGGPGSDELYGSGGNDTFPASPGSDTLTGGSGFDLVTFAARTGPVSVTLDGSANDGDAGEADNVGADVENMIGGSGPDKLTGNPSPNAIDGGPGDDVITGRAGRDRLAGGRGDDTVYARDAEKDFVEGGDGSDKAQVDAGLDVVTAVELLLA